MTVLIQLKKLRVFDALIKSKQDEIRALRSGILRSPNYSTEPKSPSPDNSSEKLNLRIIDKTTEIQAEITKLYDERDNLVGLIDSLDDPIESMVLRLFYVNGYSWREIARELNGHPKTFQNIRKSGVQHLDSIYSQNIHLV